MNYTEESEVVVTTYSADGIAALKSHDRFETQIEGLRGLAADLARDNVVVHVGKPVGSISGWVGAYYWQVWVEPFDLPGQVNARVNRAEKFVWQLDVGLSTEEVLEEAKDRVVALANDQRAGTLRDAEARLAELEAAR